MKYKFQVRRYSRVFKKPLITSRFILKERNGLIIRLENEERNVGFGEIAPLELFGSESLVEAEKLCNKAGSIIDDAFIESIDSRKVCCRFAFESAREMVQDLRKPKVQKEFAVAALINLNFNGDLENWEKYQTFKCKIGVLDFEKEKEAFILLRSRLPQASTIRLDANGSLSRNTAQKWLEFLEDQKIEYLEQPLSKGQEQAMIALGKNFQTTLALDESIVNLEDFENLLEDWAGFFIIKPSLIGDINRFKKLREKCKQPIVYSSIFETGIGSNAILKIAASDAKNNYTIGFGTNSFFLEDGFNNYSINSKLNYDSEKINDLENIWKLCI